MAAKTISLDEETSERLQTHKREGESFSDVVKWVAGERSWREVAGIWADSADDVERAIEAERQPEQVSAITVLELYEGVAHVTGPRTSAPACSKSSIPSTSFLPTTT